MTEDGGNEEVLVSIDNGSWTERELDVSKKGRFLNRTKTTLEIHLVSGHTINIVIPIYRNAETCSENGRDPESKE